MNFNCHYLDCDCRKSTGITYLIYNEFFDTFTSLYDECFPRGENKLYEKYLKNRNPQNLATCKKYKNLFAAIKSKSNKNYYSEKILSFNPLLRNDVKWSGTF